MAGKALVEGARRVLGRALADAEVAMIDRYVSRLLQWNRGVRLVGRDERQWIEREMILDSLVFLRVMPADAMRVLDLGSGAGIPGVPLKIVGVERDVTLVEARRRRVSFLRTVARELGLPGLKVVGARAESLLAEFGGTMDVVVTRCAGGVGDVLALAVRFLAPGGVAVVSGPPGPSEPPAGGAWVTVEGAAPGSTRRFAIATR